VGEAQYSTALAYVASHGLGDLFLFLWPRGTEPALGR
jgi:hypothetical protein